MNRCRGSSFDTYPTPFVAAPAVEDVGRRSSDRDEYAGELGEKGQARSDSAGSGPTQSFSDGFTPPPVDSTAWEASSHANDSEVRTCYGGTGGFGCHSTGHGSQKANLLSPPETAATSTWLTEDEEGFCLNCHDSDGPASTDLKTAFNRTINWVDQATGLNSNPNLNDRHDVQADAQARSGARIECTSCHNPHVATAARPYVLDPDPTDGRVPGTGQVYSGTDEWSEFCMDCHDGSWPTGVADSLPGIVNIRTTWALDGMGGADQPGDLTGEVSPVAYGSTGVQIEINKKI